MFNKVIDKIKIIEELGKYSATTLVNSRDEEIGKIIYDYVNHPENDRSYIRFSITDHSLYVLKLKIDNILMYDTKKNKLYIKAI